MSGASKIKFNMPDAQPAAAGDSLSLITPASSLAAAREQLQKVDELIWKDRQKKLAIETKGYAPSSHPTAVILSDWAQQLREAANQDPVLKFLGVKLPQQVEVVIVFDEAPNAFVFPDDSSKIYVTTGLQKIDASKEELISVLAHEQGHQIHYAILERQKQSAAKAPSVRFGEPIWSPGVEDLAPLAASFQKMLASKGEEHWCDTYGAYPHLDRLGIDPLVGPRMAGRLHEMSRVLEGDGAIDSASVFHNITQLLRSHPMTTERVWLSQQIASSSAFPSSLRGISREEHKEANLQVPSDEVAADFVKRFMPYFSLFLGRIDGSVGLPTCLFSGAPKAGVSMSGDVGFLTSLPSAEHALGGEDRVRIKLHCRLPDGQKNSLEKFLRRMGGSQPEERIEFGRIGDILLGGVIAYGADTYRLDGDIAVHPGNDLAAKYGKLSLPDILREIANSLSPNAGHLGNRWIKPLINHLRSGSLKSIGFSKEKDFFGLEEDLGAWMQSLREWLVNKDEKSLQKALNDSVEVTHRLHGDPRHMELVLEKTSVKGADPYEELRNLALSFQSGSSHQMVAEQFFAYKPDKINSISKLKSSSLIRKLLREWVGLVGASLPEFNSPIGQLVTNKEVGEIITMLCHRTLEIEGDSAYEFIRDIFLKACSKGAPINFKKKYREDENKCLRSLRIEFSPESLPVKHPKVLSPYIDPVRNIHEAIARANKILNEDGSIHDDFKARARHLSDAIDQLSDQPILFSASVWGKFAEEYVKSIDDYRKFHQFLGETLSQCPFKFSVWREETLVEARCRALELAILRALSESTDIAYDFNQLLSAAKELPRCSIRNYSVVELVKFAALNNDLQVNPRELLKSFEIEGSLSVSLRSIRDRPLGASRRLFDLEGELNTLDTAMGGVGTSADFNYKQYVPNAVFEVSTSKEAIEIGREFESTLVGDMQNGTIAYALHKVPKEPLIGDSVGGSELTINEDALPLILSLTPHLPVYATGTMIRHTYLELHKDEIPQPVNPLNLKPKAIQVCESSGEMVREALGEVNPLELNNQSEQFKSRQALLAYFEHTLTTFQPLATPLRDQWILHLAREAEDIETRRLLSSGDLRRLQRECYLPESKQQLGEILWNRVVSRAAHNKDGQSTLSTSTLIRYLTGVMPYYSVERNSALRKLVEISRAHDYEDASVLDALHWTPGSPRPIPSQEAILGDTYIESFIATINTFDDFQRVAALLYLTGIDSEKPFAVEYMERLLGGTFDELREKQNTLSPGARLELISRVLGGPKGIFARADGAALNYLGNAILKRVSDVCEMDDRWKGIAKAIIDDLLWKAKLPTPVRMDLLSSFMEWSSGESDTRDRHALLADLIYTAFSSLGAPGLRILQGLIIEPKAFSREISDNLRRAQDSVPSGRNQAPFHLAQADGVPEMVLGRYRGGGTLGEIHEVQSVGDKRVEGVVQKNLRPEVLRLVESLKIPLKTIATTLKRHGLSWGDELIDRVIKSCREEFNSLNQEAARTGMPMARLFTEILGSEEILNEQDYKVIIKVSDSLELVIPKAVGFHEGADKNRFTFIMGDLGTAFTTFATLVRQKGLDSLTQEVSEAGADISDIADMTAKLFVGALLSRNTLLKDLHFGNTGMIYREDTSVAQVGMVDFGGVVENFPEVDKQWILTLISSFVEQDFESLKELLLGAARRAGNSENDLRQLVPQAESMIEKLKAALSNVKSDSIFDGCEALLADLYEEWPLPVSVKEFVESLRKVGREWGPYVSQECGFVIAADLMLAAGGAGQKLKEAGFFAGIDEIANPPGHDQLLQSASSEESLEAYSKLNRIPDEASLWLKSDGQWSQFKIVGSFRPGSDQMITLKEVEGENQKKVFALAELVKKFSEGYLEFSVDDETLHRIRLGDLR